MRTALKQGATPGNEVPIMCGEYFTRQKLRIYRARPYLGRHATALFLVGLLASGPGRATCWRKTVEVERRQAGWNDWNTARAVARDMMAWKQNVAALCDYRGEKK